VADAGKVIEWLKAVSRTSIPASRAWVALSRLLRLALSKAGQDVGALAGFMPQQPHITSGFGAPLHPEDPASRNSVYMPSLAYNLCNPWVQPTVSTSSVPSRTADWHSGVRARFPGASGGAEGVQDSYHRYDRGPDGVKDEEMTPVHDMAPGN
jgi:hypothetical protein